MSLSRPVALILAPSRDAVSGVSTHLNLLLASPLAQRYRLVHFQVGSEGREESFLGRVTRVLFGPLALARAVLRHGAALVHVNTSLNKAFWRDLPMMLAARLAGARVVCQVHGGALPQAFLGPGRLAQAFLRAALGLPDALVLLAQCEMRAYRAFLPQGKISLVPNGVNYGFFSKQKMNSGKRPLQLLYFGRLAREKGLFEALEGLKIARAQGIDAELVIAGSGPDDEALRRHAVFLGLGAQVRFPGARFGREKFALLADADALLLPSYAEGLPYALLEAMAAGLPPIATPVGAIPDVVADGLHGLLVPRGDAAAIARAITALADVDRRRQMSSACRRRIATGYSLAQLAERFSDLYASLHAPRRAVRA